MLAFLKQHRDSIMIVLVTIGFIFYAYGCESRVKSLNSDNRLVNRSELQLELDQIIGMAEIKVADLDRQDALRTLILHNALILVQGQPLNPVGIITGIAALYGAGQMSNSVVKTVKKTVKRKVGNNGSA